jgi:hypothetical protein
MPRNADLSHGLVPNDLGEAPDQPAQGPNGTVTSESCKKERRAAALREGRSRAELMTSATTDARALGIAA